MTKEYKVIAKEGYTKHMVLSSLASEVEREMTYGWQPCANFSMNIIPAHGGTPDEFHVAQPMTRN